MPKHFFLGSMTPNGFYSLYKPFLDSSNLLHEYYIKSAPGSGKSSFMRRVANSAGDGNIEYIHCSGDPSSLDGVHFEDKRTVIIDATAPHVLEPSCHGAVGEYLHLGAFVDNAAMFAKAAEIRAADMLCKKSYSQAAKTLRAIEAVRDETESLSWTSESINLVQKRASSIASELITQGEGAESRLRFLSAYSDKGESAFWDTAALLCDRIFAVESKYGFSHVFMETVLRECEKKRQNVYLCLSPLLPEKRYEHVLIPGLRLGFVSSRPTLRMQTKDLLAKRINADVCELPEKYRGRLKLLLKIEKDLCGEVSEALGDARIAHDALEALYNPYVDFNAIFSLAQTLSEKLF